MQKTKTRIIDPKYSAIAVVDMQLKTVEGVTTAEPALVTLSCQIVNVISGNVIPEDEPTMIFRARDKFALRMLEFYLDLCKSECGQDHLYGVANRVNAFDDFTREHPDRMKIPGSTQGTKL